VSDGGSAVTGYRVYRGTSAGGETLLVAPAGTGTSYTDNTAVNGTTYFYRVTAVNAVGEGGLSNERSATPATTPAAPNLVSATAGNNSVALVWSAPSNGGSAISGYRVYRGTTSGLETLLAPPPGTGTSYTDTTAVNGTTYYYKVSAVNAIGESALSNELSATPAGSPTPPAAPSNLVATPLSRSRIGLSWADNASNETGFRIERSFDGSSGWHQIGTVAANVTAFTHARQPALTTFFYRVRATNATGDSAYSSVATATTLGW
jgi:fibronectin type 3 domain-containing protein